MRLLPWRRTAWLAATPILARCWLSLPVLANCGELYSPLGELHHQPGSLDMALYQYQSALYTGLRIIDPPGGSLSIAPQPDGKVITFYSGNPVPISPRTPLLRLNLDGAIDPKFVPELTGGPGGGSFNLLLQPDGKLLVSGPITTTGTVTNRGLARLNGDGSADTNFLAGSGPNGFIFGMALQADGKLLIAGRFTSFNGVGRAKVARLNSDGSLDSTFDAGAGISEAGAWLNVVAAQADGRVLIGGAFNVFNGYSITNLARLNPDGQKRSHGRPELILLLRRYAPSTSARALRWCVVPVRRAMASIWSRP